MDSSSPADAQVVPMPFSEDRRSLANLPPEILQMLFRQLFQGATIFCHCSDSRSTQHSVKGNWHILVACRRYHQEGSKLWYEIATLEIDSMLSCHLPKEMLEYCKTIRMTYLLTRDESPYSLFAERDTLAKFAKSELLQLPKDDSLEYCRPDSIPNDEEVVQMRSSLYEVYVDWAREVVAYLPNITVKLQKQIYIFNIIDMYLICDIVITKDQTKVHRTLKRYVYDEDKVEGSECLDECKQLLVELGIDTTGTTWG